MLYGTQPQSYRYPRPPSSTPTTMSQSSNSQTSAALNAAGRKPSASASDAQDGIKLVTVGKDTIAIPLLAIAGINDPAYSKAASFHNLSDTAYGLLDTYNPSAVTLFVTQELPINTSLALAEASAVVGSIKSFLLDVDALTPVSFIDKDWELASTTNPRTLANREEGLFGVKLAVNIQGHAIDSRIAKTRVFQSELVLLLPQHNLDSADGSVTEVSSPARASVSVNLFATPRRNTTAGAGGTTGTSGTGGSGGPGGSSTTASTLSPKMSNLFGSGGGAASTIKRGYYGPMTFFDSQSLFNDCFGENPTMYSAVYQQSTWDTEAFNKFVSLCRFDIFMSCCQLHYIGSDNVSRESYVREVCNNLADVRQVRKDNIGKEVVDTPEELFQRFVHLAASLPDDTTTWTIQLPSQFLTALDSKIRNKIVTSDTFTMPTPSSLNTKADQINGTRSIKNEATSIFNDIEERKLEMKEQLALLSKNITARQQTRVGAAYNSQSLAEGVLQEYKGPASNHPDVEIRKGADGKSYPFHIPTQFLSTFPVGFRGCYVCGSTDHWKREDCEKSKSGQFHRQTFFRNLWAHRPHTHKIKNSPPNSERALTAGGAAQGTHSHCHIIVIHLDPRYTDP